MLVWRDLDTESALKRFQILHVLSLMPLFVVLISTIYFHLSYSFSFFTGFAFLKCTPLGIRWGGELVIPVVTSTTVFMVAFLFISLPFEAIFMCAITFSRPFKDVKGFEKFGRVYEEIKPFIVQLSNREKLIVIAFILTSILTYLFISLWLTVQLGMLTSTYSSSFLFISLINLLGFLYFNSRIKRVLKLH